MRRTDKKISDLSAIEAIIRSARVCRLAFSDGAHPYIVPMCFGYHDNTLYFHCAPEGRKLEFIKKNPKACFEFDEGVEVVPNEKPCRWGMKYKSIIGYGKIEFVEQKDDKRRALEIIMAQYSNGSYEFVRTELEKITVITVFKIIIDEMTGKQSGYSRIP